MITVQLVDDHWLVRAGVRRMLENERDIKVVVESEGVGDGVQDFVKHHPAVVVMDMTMADGTGLEATQQILQKDATACIIILSMHDDNARTFRAMKTGAKGYITKGCDPKDLVNAVRSVARGEMYLEPKIAQTLAVRQMGGDIDPYEALTDRDFDVFLMLAEGWNIKEIADSLCLSPKTVGASRTRVLKKLGAANVATLAHIAIRYGLIAA